ncbi:hypothetical protein FR483_n006R [Paramecium bursaria Chlorella virus FR483]|uniref:Uncharacterized protein n006R n=1 Tax=Paramecium bursaria Chlorella virus FR483 TaxID=399781 RepID=A7J660_PBCVF|nr:hypothetical protein FR483_n006R [Paramecium bursaria Chlorella virus FR483]ABT15291.1 hypothetical protein FR483_n006R [Paramecium bursaria Chlorella virus FR483]
MYALKILPLQQPLELTHVPHHLSICILYLFVGRDCNEPLSGFLIVSCVIEWQYTPIVLPLIHGEFAGHFYITCSVNGTR